MQSLLDGSSKIASIPSSQGTKGHTPTESKILGCCSMLKKGTIGNCVCCSSMF